MPCDTWAARVCFVVEMGSPLFESWQMQSCIMSANDFISDAGLPFRLRGSGLHADPGPQPELTDLPDSRA